MIIIIIVLNNDKNNNYYYYNYYYYYYYYYDNNCYYFNSNISIFLLNFSKGFYFRLSSSSGLICWLKYSPAPSPALYKIITLQV